MAQHRNLRYLPLANGIIAAARRLAEHGQAASAAGDILTECIGAEYARYRDFSTEWLARYVQRELGAPPAPGKDSIRPIIRIIRSAERQPPE